MDGVVALVAGFGVVANVGVGGGIGHRSLELACR
jgi:hypothetical protein